MNAGRGRGHRRGRLTQLISAQGPAQQRYVRVHKRAAGCPKLRVGAKVQVQRPGGTEGAIGMSFPADIDGGVREFVSYEGRFVEPSRPLLDEVCGGEQVPLVVVAGVIGKDKILDAVVRMACPREEVVDLGT